jgi:hypothetical protein
MKMKIILLLAACKTHRHATIGLRAPSFSEASYAREQRRCTGSLGSKKGDQSIWDFSPEPGGRGIGRQSQAPIRRPREGVGGVLLGGGRGTLRTAEVHSPRRRTPGNGAAQNIGCAANRE